MRAWVIAVAFLFVSSPAWADDWVAYKSKTGGGAASYPGGPTESTKDVDGNTLHLAMYSDLGGAQYMLLWADRSKDAPKGTTKQMFDAAQAPMARRAKIVSSMDFAYRGVPARDVHRRPGRRVEHVERAVVVDRADQIRQDRRRRGIGQLVAVRGAMRAAVREVARQRRLGHRVTACRAPRAQLLLGRDRARRAQLADRAAALARDGAHAAP